MQHEVNKTIEGLYVDLKSKYYNDPSIKMAQTLNKFEMDH